MRRVWYAAAVLTVLGLAGCAGAAERRFVAQLKNKPAPDFELTALDGAKVRLTAIRVVEPAQGDPQLSTEQLQEPIPPPLRRTLGEPRFIPWEKLTDQVPSAPTANGGTRRDRRNDFGGCYSVESHVAIPRSRPWSSATRSAPPSTPGGTAPSTTTTTLTYLIGVPP